MAWFKKKPVNDDILSDEPLVAVFIPPLVVTLEHMESEKGSPLTEAEVLELRDTLPTIALPLSAQSALAKSRGYEDIDPENVWQEWMAHRAAQG